MRADRVVAWTALVALSTAFVDAALCGSGGGRDGHALAELDRLLEREAELCRQIERVRRPPTACDEPATAEPRCAEYHELNRVRDRIRTLEHRGS